MKLVSSKERPTGDAIDQGGDVWLVVTDGDLDCGEDLIGTDARDAVPQRTDIDPDHPLYGERALRNVPAGSPDIVVNADGGLETVAAEAQVAPVVIGGDHG